MSKVPSSCAFHWSHVQRMSWNPLTWLSSWSTDLPEAKPAAQWRKHGFSVWFRFITLVHAAADNDLKRPSGDRSSFIKQWGGMTFFVPFSQDCAHVGRELWEAAQGSVQAAVRPGKEGRSHVLHLQPRWKAGGGRMSGWHHPDLGPKPQRESPNKRTHARTHSHTLTVTTRLQKAVNTGCLFYCNAGSSVRRAERSKLNNSQNDPEQILKGSCVRTHAAQDFVWTLDGPVAITQAETQPRMCLFGI